MSATTGKTREEILAERQEKKQKKAAMKNHTKGKNPPKESDSDNKKGKGQYIPKMSSNKDFESSKYKDITNSCRTSDVSVSASKSKSASEMLIQGLKEQCRINEEMNKQFKNKPGKGDGKVVKDSKSSSHIKDAPANQVEAEKLDKTLGNGISVTSFKSNEQGSNQETKTKAQLKAERRAKQEAERAKKLEKSQNSSQEKKVSAPPKKEVQPVKTVKTASNLFSSNLSHKVKLFAHLYKVLPETDTVDSPIDVHPSIKQLGLQYSSRVVTGANARCLALLNGLKKVILDFETPPNQEFSRGLEAEITKSMTYLSKCRPAAVSMISAIKHLKFQVNQTKGNEIECKNALIEWIDTYHKEQLEMAAKAIGLYVKEKISSGDVILTYGCSSLIQQILISVHNDGTNFQVIVVDGRPGLEGRVMLRKLVSAGICCTYVFVNGLSFIMPEVTKILLGAHAILANGYVVSRVGTSQIALLAKTYNVPVLVCCETHKFSERVQTDSFVYNEIGNPDDLVSNQGCLSKELSKWKSIPYLTPLNLTYDVTPPELVTAVITEIAVLPCTSVPVILRIKPPDVSC